MTCFEHVVPPQIQFYEYLNLLGKLVFLFSLGFHTHVINVHAMSILLGVGVIKFITFCLVCNKLRPTVCKIQQQRSINIYNVLLCVHTTGAAVLLKCVFFS